MASYNFFLFKTKIQRCINKAVTFPSYLKYAFIFVLENKSVEKYQGSGGPEGVIMTLPIAVYLILMLGMFVISARYITKL